MQLDEKGNVVNRDSLCYQSLDRASAPTGQLSRARNEIARLRTALTVFIALSSVLGFGAVALAFEVLRLRDVIGGVL